MVNESTASWPPVYTLRASQRAKQPSLQISLKHGLVVVVPKQWPNQDIRAVLDSKRSWIEKQLSRVQRLQATRLQEPELPTSLYLQAVGETIVLEYCETQSQSFTLHKVVPSLINSHSRLHSDIVYSDQTQPLFETAPRWEHYQVCGPIHQPLGIASILQHILMLKALNHLPRWLQKISLETGLSYSQIKVRQQATRWGSCSAKQVINLNAKLLFLPGILVRYVLLHELCHTRHLNHSNEYWALLKKFDPDYLQHQKALRTAMEHLPGWVD